MLLPFALLLLPLLPQSSSEALQSLWGDWNADGRRDLLLVEGGQARLFEDAGEAGFLDITHLVGLDVWSDLGSVLWEDLDADGFQDLLLARRAGGGAFLAGLAEGGWRRLEPLAGLDLERPLSRARRIGTELLLEGPDGLRLARFDADLGWSEFLLGSAPRTHAVPFSNGVSGDARDAESSGALNLTRTARPAGPSQIVLPGSLGTATPLLGPLAFCAKSIQDQATSQCLTASSQPTLGKLYPLSTAWNVTSAGDVGVGTTTPGAKLDVLGIVRGQQLVSTAGAFTAPLTVGSSVKVANLNADKLDGIDSSAFSQLGNSIEGSEISLGTIDATRLANPLTASGTGVTTLRVTAAGLASTAIRGEASGGSGNVGVRGESTSTTGSAYGVRGISASSTGRGVSGEVTATSGANVGVYASTPSTSGTAIQAVASATNGNTVGVRVTNASTAGMGVYSLATKAGAFETYGVVGEVTSDEGAGVLGRVYNGSVSGLLAGVSGYCEGLWGVGVYGALTDPNSAGWGVLGTNASSVGYAVYAAGDLGASGTKSFVQPHPTDASKEIRFVCLEGNESGTYFRGSAELVQGRAVIEVPEEFRLVSEEQGLTAQISARGQGRLWIESLDIHRLVVRGDVEAFDYLVNGFRRGFEDIELVRENRNWVPSERGVPYGTQFPDALRRVLVENGTLNADFTPNEAKAAALGWTLRDPRPALRRPGASSASLGTESTAELE